MGQTLKRSEPDVSDRARHGKAALGPRVASGPKIDYVWTIPADGELVVSPAPEDDHLARIVTDPGICGGRPVIRGTRVRVTDVLGMLAENVTRQEILADFSYLTDDDITAALAYAAEVMDHPVVVTA